MKSGQRQIIAIISTCILRFHISGKVIIMKVYNKVLFSDETSLMDCLHHHVGLLNSYNSDLVLKGRNVKELPELLNYQDFSLVIDYKKDILFNDINEKLLDNMEKIEMMFLQTFFNVKKVPIIYNVYLEYLKIIDNVKDGHFGKDEFDSCLLKLIKQNPKTSNAIIIADNLRTLNNTIVDELFHAQFRIIDSINNQILNLKAYVNKRELKYGEEHITNSLYADNVAYLIQDAIKAVYKVLDVISKFMNYLNEGEKIKNKIPQFHFSNSKAIIDNWDEGFERTCISRLFDDLQLYTTIRNEIIHNISFDYNRQYLYLGRGTNAIHYNDLYYSDMPFWDYKGKEILRSYNRIGFYKQNRNAVSEIQLFFIKTLKFLCLCMKYYYTIFEKKIKDAKIQSIFFWDNSKSVPCIKEVKAKNIWEEFNTIDIF